VPNFFVPLSRARCDEKIDHILAAFASQRDRYWFTDDTFRSLLRLRGVEARAATGYAEAFHARKITARMPEPGSAARLDSRDRR
jgi:hypothetical protein